MSSISDLILDFVSMSLKDKNQRYKSWEHCYSFFRKHAFLSGEEAIDLAALHLGFYLASWGMYRGSGFLLQKDYKIHKYAVKALLQPKYDSLWDIDFGTLQKYDGFIDLIFELKKHLLIAMCQI